MFSGPRWKSPASPPSGGAAYAAPAREPSSASPAATAARERRTAPKGRPPAAPPGIAFPRINGLLHPEDEFDFLGLRPRDRDLLGLGLRLPPRVLVPAGDLVVARGDLDGDGTVGAGHRVEG